MLLDSPADPVASPKETRYALALGPLQAILAGRPTTDDEALLRVISRVYAKLHRLTQHTMASEKARQLSFRQRLSWYIATLFMYYAKNRSAFHLFMEHDASRKGDADPRIAAFFTGQHRLLKKRLATAIEDDFDTEDFAFVEAYAAFILAAIHDGLQLPLTGEEDLLTDPDAFQDMVYGLSAAIHRMCLPHVAAHRSGASLYQAVEAQD